MTKYKPRKIVDAKADSDGNITHVKIVGNQRFTPVKTAIKMAKHNQIDAVLVKAAKLLKNTCARNGTAGKRTILTIWLMTSKKIILIKGHQKLRSYAVETLLNKTLLEIKDLRQYIILKKARKLLIFHSTA